MSLALECILPRADMDLEGKSPPRGALHCPLPLCEVSSQRTDHEKKLQNHDTVAGYSGAEERPDSTHTINNRVWYLQNTGYLALCAYYQR